MSYNISNPNPYNLSFPYPLQGEETRPPGQGCISCIHRTYCPAIYWYNRRGKGELTDDHGRSCDSWSDNPDDKVTEVTEDDLAHNEYIMKRGIAGEADNSGITGGVTGSSRR